MIPKLVTGVVALSKYAHACQDDKQWSACIDAYRNGECHAFVGCDRTCGKCFGESDCYDKIPENHSFLFATGASAQAIWPNLSNQNSVPVVSIDMDDHFPFDRTSISQFCLDIFDSGLCDESQNLKLTYSDSDGGDINIDLYGTAKEYCGFTCGNCKANGDNGECWTQHNSNMQYLSTINAGIGKGGHIDIDTDNWFDDTWGDDDSTNSEEASDEGFGDYGWGDSYDTWGVETEETYDDEEESDGGWGGGWDSGWGDGWGRKRRSAAVQIDKAEILAEAIESFVFPQFKDMLPMNSRDRSDRRGRSAFSLDWMMNGQQPAQHDEVIRVKDEMGDLRCFKSMMNNDAQEDYEEGEEAEEEGAEQEEDPYVRVRQQRKSTDHVGIRNWVRDNTPEGTTLDGECSDFVVPVEEAYSEMELAYFCRIKCTSGTPHVQMGEEQVPLDDEFQMKCSKARYHRFKEAAVCSASAYCVGTACNPIVCLETTEFVYDDIEETSEGEDEDLWGNDWGSDFMY